MLEAGIERVIDKERKLIIYFGLWFPLPLASGGCNGCIKPSSRVRCRAKVVRLTMLAEKDYLAD